MPRNERHGARRTDTNAFTLIELLFIIAAIALLIGILVPALGHRHGCGSVELKDKTQLRGMIQGMVIYAQSNDDKYPLPSALDSENTTTAAEGIAKNTTANTFSRLIWDGYLPPELAFSPVEVNGNITEDDDYQFEDPSAAVDPERAQWDPAFRADFRDAEHPGNVSYAHLLPHGARLKNWANTFNALTPQIANRGPQITALDLSDPSDPRPTYANPASNTFNFMGSRASWSGTVGYADGHVDTQDVVTRPDVVYEFEGGPRPDVIFYDEPDDPAGINAFLSVFVEPGPDTRRPLDIWD